MRRHVAISIGTSERREIYRFSHTPTPRHRWRTIKLVFALVLSGAFGTRGIYIFFLLNRTKSNNVRRKISFFIRCLCFSLFFKPNPEFTEYLFIFKLSSLKTLAYVTLRIYRLRSRHKIIWQAKGRFFFFTFSSKYVRVGQYFYKRILMLFERL